MERTKLGELCWTDLAAKDIDAQSRFYEDLLGWGHRDVPTNVGIDYRMFTSGEDVVAAASPMQPEMMRSGAPSMWNTYIAAPDLDAAAQKAQQLGARVVMPAMDIMEEGRIVGLADPTRAIFFLFQPRKHRGASKFMQPGTLMWNDLSTHEPERAAEFYSRLFGWQVERQSTEGPPYWQVSVNGEPQAGIMPMPENMPSEVPAHWLVYFGTEDAVATTEKVQDLGGSAQMEPMDVNVTTFSVVSDPMGAMFALMEPLRA